MSEQEAPKSVVESPWYWVYVFGIAALVAILLLGSKFQQRQAQIERTYQGREQALKIQSGEQDETELKSADELSTPGKTLLTLRPLMIIIGVVVAVAWSMVWWQFFRSKSLRRKKDKAPSS